jgi:hypothetical protein
MYDDPARQKRNWNFSLAHGPIDAVRGQPSRRRFDAPTLQARNDGHGTHSRPVHDPPDIRKDLGPIDDGQRSFGQEQVTLGVNVEEDAFERGAESLNDLGDTFHAPLTLCSIHELQKPTWRNTRKVLDHVGLLINEPLAVASCPLVSHPTTRF